ncbi:MAG TPA: tetratricopeptide repeat protein [Melioribacteraceae bacterium]|nr:tetratricopeptide repeat protein [Melioribacteraceae bacterium]
MIGRLALYSIVIVVISFNLVFAGSYPNKSVDNLIRSGVDFLLNHNHEAAKYKFNELNKLYPKIPLGKIYLAVLEIAKSIDYAEKFNDNKIEQLLDDAKELSDSLYKKNKKDLWNTYFVALSKGYDAYYKGMNGNYLSAITNGISSITYYERCLEIDSLFYDSYIALGTYYYWKSEKTKSLTWLPFVSDDRPLGKRLLEKSIGKDTYGRFLGAYSLVWIYIDNKEFNNAINLCKDVLSDYPDNRFFKLSLARIYTELDKYKAISIFQEVLETTMRLERNNHVNEIELKHKIAMQYNDLGKYEKSLEYCKDILQIKVKDKYAREQLSNRLERVKKLYEELLEKVKK